MTTAPDDRLPESILATEEGRRLQACRDDPAWRAWGPYLSERQWGTVREDYSPGGTAWDYLPHDHARSRAYRWGEDGLAGFADEHLNWCLGLGLWNGRDPILKERLFGLANAEGNHGEDVKELYYYLDGVPTHAYMRMLYKYPQMAFPYDRLVAENRRRGVHDREFELIDTGVFDEDRYFDVVVEYAKAAPDDILMQVSVHNRGPDAANLHVLPQLWARNRWSWKPGVARPRLRTQPDGSVAAEHPSVAPMTLAIEPAHVKLFCENETNGRRVFGIDTVGFFKDGINDCIVGGHADAVNPAGEGSKFAAHIILTIPAGGSQTVRLRFRPTASRAAAFADFASVLATRLGETDAFYAALQGAMPDPDKRLVQRQALAGMLWSKQYYGYDVRIWLAGDPGEPPPPPERQSGRNADWQHLHNGDILLMPDAWEYPWYASWDLAFHCVTLALIDPDFAKDQLLLLTRSWYQHPNGQLPAYEWAFGDVDPPVHAWAAWRVYQMERALTGRADTVFLEQVFHKLLLNFTWWVNRKDADGRNIFQGGFLGLDNISIFDRSNPLPTGGTINQSDGTAWMAMYTLDLLHIAIELALADHAYEPMAVKFFEHFLYIAEAMGNIGGTGIGLWDEQDSFFYDVLNLPDGDHLPLRVRSMVGLIPLFAVAVLGSQIDDRLPNFAAGARWIIEHRPDLANLISRWQLPGMNQSILLSLLRGHRTKCLLARMLDPSEFLSDHGVRALSKIHETHPFMLEHGGMTYRIGYVPGESDSNLFGGNSNWRGPVWMPVNFMLIESLYEFQRYYGDDFQVQCPVGSGTMMSLREVADELCRRVNGLFLRGPDGRRPVFGDYEKFQADPHFRDYVLFHEYFHGDTGRGVGASHQTGWTGLVALLLHPRAAGDPGKLAFGTVAQAPADAAVP
ncbi:MAG TPA: glucosidase [Acetobacteraceae bacterium]|nr:glucosidase [Acetobacteraceae bacterium]